MSQRVLRVIENHPVLCFYVLAFLISWSSWIPQLLFAYQLFPLDHPLFNFLGGAGPTLAAVIVLWVTKGRNSVGELFATLGKWKAPLFWYLFVFLFWFTAAGCALVLGKFFGVPIPDFGSFLWITLLPIFITMLLSNVWEEIGWRGFALPELQKKYSDWQIVLIMGVLWSVWHLPLMLNPTSPMAGLPWLAEVLFSLALTTLYIWIYNHTERSLFFVTIFHAMSNTIAYILLTMDVFEQSYVFVVAVTSLAAVLVVLQYGAQRFGISEID